MPTDSEKPCHRRAKFLEQRNTHCPVVVLIFESAQQRRGSHGTIFMNFEKSEPTEQHIHFLVVDSGEGDIADNLVDFLRREKTESKSTSASGT
jgi:hypothetical protein